MRFVDDHRDQFAVALLLRVLEIEESTYYGWVKRVEQPCDRKMVDRGLLGNIHEIWEASGRTYGADRVWRQLRRDGRKRVERLMRQQGWQGACLRRGWRGGSTRQDPKATGQQLGLVRPRTPQRTRRPGRPPYHRNPPP